MFQTCTIDNQKMTNLYSQSMQLLIQCPGESVEEDIYDPEEDQEPNISKEYIHLEYKIKAVEYVEPHPNYSLKTRVKI